MRLENYSDNFENENNKLVCEFCNKIIDYAVKHHVTGHINSKVHKRNHQEFEIESSHSECS